jgi:SulP family sulfate permease
MAQSMAEGDTRPGMPVLRTVLRAAWAALLIAALTVSFVISFTAIIYSGPLAPFLSTGIGLSLLGAALMCAVGGAFYTYRGTICHPQDVTAIVLAVSATGIASSWAFDDMQGLLATIVMLVAVATATAGIATYLFGYFRLGFLARFVPYPVVGGFLAATGYLLLLGSIGMGLGETFHLSEPSMLVDDGALLKWLPWVLLGVAIAVIAARVQSELLLPGSLLIAALLFYGGLLATGTSLAEAEEAGLMLGPFPEGGFLEVLSPALIRDAHWNVILGESVTLIAVALLTVVGTLLHATGLELAMDQEFDLEKDLRATGIANVAGALGGGLIGFQLMSGTTLGNKLHLPGILPGLSAAAGCAVTFLFGGEVLGSLPVGLFVTVVAYLGADFLLTWLWLKRRQMSRADYGLVLLILVVSAAVGFFEALGVGVLAAAGMFILSLSRDDVVRLRSTLASRRSLVERSDADVQHLTETGGEVVVLELSGHLFFGTANRLLETVRAEIAANPKPRVVILDFFRVRGLDASASHSLDKLAKACARARVRLVLSGIGPKLADAYLRGATDFSASRLAPTLDAALRAEEDFLLAERGRTEPSGADATAALPLGPLAGIAASFPQVTLKQGEVLLTQGAASSEMFVLLSGAMHAEVSRPDGGTAIVARFVPGAIVGEIAFYSGVPRTATVIADDHSVLLRIDAAALRAPDESATPAETLHEYAATSLARRLRTATLLLRDAEI